MAVVGALILGAAAAALAFRAYGNSKEDEVRRIETSALVTSDDYSQFLSGRALVSRRSPPRTVWCAATRPGSRRDSTG